MSESTKQVQDVGFDAFLGRLWNRGSIDEATPHGVSSLIDVLVEKRSPRIALLLGLIVEGDAADETRIAARNAVKRGFPHYLDLLSPYSGRREPLFLALLYLLAHFPEEKQRILEHLGKHGLVRNDDDWIRLERVLSFQEASSPDFVAHVRRLMPVPIGTSSDQAWRTIVASVLAPLGAEAAHAILQHELG